MVESYTIRAEREAVQDAVDQVWVLAVRCLEELRALQTVAKSAVTYGTIDEIRKGLEPLREQLDGLVKATSEDQLDGALEKAADLKASLEAVLAELAEAREQDVGLVWALLFLHW